MVDNETSTRLNQTPPADPPAPAKPKSAQQKLKDARAAKAAARAEKLVAREERMKQNPKWTPFVDKDSLPNDAVIDKKGKVHKAGTMHYALRVSPLTGTVKLIGLFRNGKGLGSKLIRALKPQKKNSRGAQDRALLKELRLAGLPELD